MTPNVFESPLLSGLFGDPEIAGAFASEKVLAHYCAFEIELTRALADEELIDAAAAAAIVEKAPGFHPDLAGIAAASGRDGMPVPEYVRQFRAFLGPDLAVSFHVGTTSQDLIDTALVLCLREVNAILATRIKRALNRLGKLVADQGSRPLMGRTRMQAALPITAGDRLNNWRAPLGANLERLESLAPKLEVLQFGGPVGTLHAYESKGRAVAARLASALELGAPQKPWHTERDQLAEYASWLSLVTGAVGKIGQDVCLMAQQGVDEIKLTGGGGSSAMSHKQNPITAELLVTLSRFNAVQVAGLHQALVHEQERSGANWTLEWMILPQMCLAAGTALRTANRLLNSIERIGDP
ncbi:MAG: 3-carboxy-cis,cis-muconate cycloisomerase [Pseudomonadota bacterium]